MDLWSPKNLFLVYSCHFKNKISKHQNLVYVIFQFSKRQIHMNECGEFSVSQCVNSYQK